MQISSNPEDRHTVEYNQYLKHLPILSMYLSPAHNEEIEDCLRAFKTDTPGHDISPKILRHTSTLLCKPLTYIINLALKTGIFPNKLKTAKVIPLHKKGDRSYINNYRPIPILPAFSKIF